MDISTPLIFVALFLLAFCSLFLVYKFGIKEKSYEEALAEQRQTTNALLGVKPKPKEKKNKKAAKKLKEKSNPPGNETDESENIENAENSHPVKLHVEFKEEPEELPIKEVVQIKPKRVKKVRPILINKDKSPEKVILDVVETPIANHFEENPPKDEFELLRSNSRDDIFKQETVKDKTVKDKKQTSEASPPTKSNKKAAKQQVATNSNATETSPVVEKEVEEKVVEVVTALPQTNGIVGNPGKEKKKKKSEFNTRQQMSAERDGLIKLVRKAEFSKSEIQLLIDLLLNKQLEAPEVIDDWSEGKSDPVQKLKKQLAEKEKALAEEQEALVGVQAKLKEIRTEQQAERSQLQQKIRGLEELIQNRQIEYQATNNRLQVNSQKIQQLQTELSEEIMKTRKIVEENEALQMQIKQFEGTLTQIQETDSVVAALRRDCEELSGENQHLRSELQLSVSEKERQQQQYIIQIDNLEKGLTQQIQQHEESRQNLERNLEMALIEESNWKAEISTVNAALQQQYEEKSRLELIVEQLKNDLQVLNNEKVENVKIITQLNSEIQQLQEEQVSQVNGSSEESKAHEVEFLNLTNELSSAKNELSSIRVKLQQTETRYKTELENSNKKFSTIQAELEEQKKKNNKIKNEILAKERDSQKEFIRRLFPEIEDLQAVTSEDWQAEVGKLIKSYVSDLKKQQSRSPSLEDSENIAELQAQVQHYKDIIDDTAGTLNRLQSNTQKEEINWRCQLQAKETDLKNLKENYVPSLKSKIQSLEQQLSNEIKLKEEFYQECCALKTNQPQPSEARATIEKLAEKVNRLREQLLAEQSKAGDVNVSLKAQNSNCNNSNSTNGPAATEGAENQL